jgi:hypothetical protein
MDASPRAPPPASDFSCSWRLATTTSRARSDVASAIRLVSGRRAAVISLHVVPFHDHTVRSDTKLPVDVA